MTLVADRSRRRALRVVGASVAGITLVAIPVLAQPLMDDAQAVLKGTWWASALIGLGAAVVLGRGVRQARSDAQIARRAVRLGVIGIAVLLVGSIAGAASGGSLELAIWFGVCLGVLLTAITLLAGQEAADPHDSAPGPARETRRGDGGSDQP